MMFRQVTGFPGRGVDIEQAVAFSCMPGKACAWPVSPGLTAEATAGLISRLMKALVEGGQLDIADVPAILGPGWGFYHPTLSSPEKPKEDV